MAIKVRNGAVFLYFRPFRNGELVGLKMAEGVGKREAKRVEAAIIAACRTETYENLDSASKEAAVRLFQNRDWALPAGLVGEAPKPTGELILWDAAKMFLRYPEIKDNPGRWRHEIALGHIVAHFGKECAVRGIWVPQLKQYRAERLSVGMKPTSVNREMATMSRLFGVLQELQLVEVNPCRLVKRLSEKGSQRQAYVGYEDFLRILAVCRDWYKPIVQIAYYTGMRRGEILGLTRSRVKLSRRMILLGPEDTKERNFKRIPLRMELIPVFEEAMKVTAIGDDHVFLMSDEKGIRPVGVDACKNPWRRRISKLGWENKPRLHDLRHTWRANARRSGMDPMIAETILGHWNRERSVNERYGRLSDEELLRAVDAMNFDNGETEILVSHGG